MRASFFLLASALAVSAANAAVLDERAISSAAQLCITDLQSLGDQMAVIADSIHSIPNITATGYSGALALHSKEQNLENRIKQASKDCCAIPSTVSSEEAESMLAIVGAFVTRTPSALEEIAARKSEFDALLLTSALVKSDVKNLQNYTEVLTTCLLAKTPTTPLNYLESAKQYVNTLNAQFTIAKDAYASVK